MGIRGGVYLSTRGERSRALVSLVESNLSNILVDQRSGQPKVDDERVLV